MLVQGLTNINTMIEYVDFPEIPADIAQKILASAKDYVKSFKSDRNNIDEHFSDYAIPEFTDKTLGVLLSEGLKIYPDLAWFSSIPSPDFLVTWIEKNMPVEVLPHVQIMHGGNRVVPHIDEKRRFSYNYLLTDEGSTTEFYRPADEYKDYTYAPYMTFAPEKLTLVEQLVITPRKWHKFPSTTIHGVKLSVPFRVSIAIDII